MPRWHRRRTALILKKYYNFGVAVDTPDGLVVPVIKDVDRKGILELSQELSSVSARDARRPHCAVRISRAERFRSRASAASAARISRRSSTRRRSQFSALCRASIKPVWDGATFKPRLILPLCVSYDHRAVDGVLAARFL